MKWWNVSDDRRTRDRAIRWLESRGIDTTDVYLIEFFDDDLDHADTARVHRFAVGETGRHYLGPSGDVATLPPLSVALRPGEYDTIKTPGRG